jgi:Predicted membrane-associated Zn-dependent proteases 1
LVIWNAIWPFLIALLLLFSLVVVHELGHFLMGKALKFKIEEFAVGFGPKLLSRKGKDGVLYSFRALPIGGFCRFHDNEEGKPEPGAFASEKPWKRLLVLLAGPAMNVLLAFLLAVVLLGAFGVPVVKIGSIVPDSPAQLAGLETGDLLMKIDGEDALSYRMLDQLKDANADGVSLTVLHDGSEKDIFVADIYNAEEGRNMLGINMVDSGQKHRLSAGNLLFYSGEYMWRMSTQMVKGILSLFAQPAKIVTQASGPVGTINIIQEGIRQGVSTALEWAMIFSLNLGIFNLMPFPALDGGRILLTLIEMVRRKPLSRNLEGMINLAGFACLMLIMVMATFGDISRLIGG